MKENDKRSCEVELYTYYSALQTKDVNGRRHFLELLEKNLKELAFVHGENSENENEISLGKHLPIVLRLSYECPFPDVREHCTRILQDFEDKGIKVPRKRFAGPSSFIPSFELTQIDTDDEEVHLLLVEAFLLSGKVGNIKRLLSFHARYLQMFTRAESFFLLGEGPLPFDWRYYIGIMASSRYQCSYLVQSCERDFLLQNGNITWLKGVSHVPPKLQKISELNKLLAHRPWLITVDHIKELLKGPADETWSVSELIHAVVIMAHFHALSGLVYGCGMNPEIDQEGGCSCKTPSVSDSSSNAEPSNPSPDLAENCVHNHANNTPHNSMALIEIMKKVEMEHENEEETSQEEILRQFMSVETGELSYAKDEAVCRATVEQDYERYSPDLTFQYEDFAKRDRENISPLRAQDYSWQEHGFSLLNRLFPNIGPLLDEKFRTIVEMTYYTMGNVVDVDTTTFRLATWNYIHLVLGIFHDDYRYDEVNTLLCKPYKTYIKTVACFPNQVTQLDYLNFMTDLLHSEKVHINLLVMEAKLQAELLYALRTLMKYMT